MFILSRSARHSHALCTMASDGESESSSSAGKKRKRSKHEDSSSDGSARRRKRERRKDKKKRKKSERKAEKKAKREHRKAREAEREHDDGARKTPPPRQLPTVYAPPPPEADEPPPEPPARSMGAQRPEEAEAARLAGQRILKVWDPSLGVERSVRANGEIVEQCVSRAAAQQLQQDKARHVPTVSGPPAQPPGPEPGETYTGRTKFPSQHPWFGYK